MLSRVIQKAADRMSRQFTAAILIGAIICGSAAGVLYPQSGDVLASQLDNMIILLVFLIFFEMRGQGFLNSLNRIPFIAVLLGVNFVVIPALGFAISSAFLSNHQLILFGLAIYFMAPCTDWFLGFTHLAKGNITLGAALLPINMIIQLLLYPVYLSLFGMGGIQVDVVNIVDALSQWFLIPFLLALSARFLVSKFMSTEWLGSLSSLVTLLIPILLALLVGQIFADNVGALIDHANILPLVLGAIIVFFALTLLMSEALARLLKLNYEDHVLLTMTTSARNAPLMLALTIAVLPNQPLIHAAIILGMMIELPYLVALKVMFQFRLAMNRMMSAQH